MEIGKAIIANLRERVLPVSGGVRPGACDWHILIARLQTAHAARMQLIDAELHELRIPGGSFGSRSSRVVRSTHDVNPSVSADGKVLAGITVSAVADRPSDGQG